MTVKRGRDSSENLQPNLQKYIQQREAIENVEGHQDRAKMKFSNGIIFLTIKKRLCHMVQEDIGCYNKKESKEK